MRKHFLYALATIAVALLAVWACEESDSFLPATGQGQQETQPAITEIRKLIDDGDGLSLPVLIAKQDSAQTRHRASRPDYDPHGLQVMWDSMKTFTKGMQKVYWIPLKPDKDIVGYVRTRVNGRKTGRVNTAVFHLMAWEETDGMKTRIVTYIPDNHFLRKGRKASDLGYDVRGTEFSGISLHSTLEGRFIEGKRYQKGKAKFAFRLRGTTGEFLNKAMLDSLNRKYKVHVNLTSNLTLTRSGFDYEDFDYTCSMCGLDENECSCYEVVYCSECHNSEDACVCCGICGHYPCTCSSAGSEWKDWTGGGSSSGGGSGGGSGSTPPPPVAPKAQKIFRNSKMTDANWKTIERLLEKIMKDPMGKALYDALVTALNGKTIIFNFGEGTDSWFNYNNGDGIVLGKMAAESNRLLHEMWHAYQAYQETTTSYGNALLNLEIEAHYVQYLYLTGLEEFYEPGNKWKQWYTMDERMRNIANLNEYIDDEGNLRNNKSTNKLKEHLNATIKTFNDDETYSSYKNDTTRTALDNFKNLRKLMKK